jgi:hypothetical protein
MLIIYPLSNKVFKIYLKIYNLEKIALKLDAHWENMKKLICDPFKVEEAI